MYAISTSGSLIWTNTLEGRKYEFVIKDDEDTIKFKMGLLDLDGQYFIDLYPHDDCYFFGGDDCYALDNLLRNYFHLLPYQQSF